MLINIEKNIEEAKDYVGQGEKQLIEAKKWYQQTKTVNALSETLLYINRCCNSVGSNSLLCI